MDRMNTVNRLCLATGILAMLIAACKKDHGNPAPPGGPSGTPMIYGKWTIVTVTTIAYDSNGIVLAPRGNVYTNPPNNFFTFNTDGTWIESLLPDSLADGGLNGHFTITTDTSFILANSTGVDEACHIDSLTGSLMVWRHRRGADFNGTIPGYLDYVFRMTK
jgi:hypothetical protein